MHYIFATGVYASCIRYGQRKRACIFDGLVICLHRVEHHNKGVKRLRATYTLGEMILLNEPARRTITSRRPAVCRRRNQFT